MDIQEVTEGNDVWFVARLLRPDNVILSRDAIAGSGGSNTDAFQVRVYDVTKDSLGTGANGRQVHTEDVADNALTSILLTATTSASLTNDGYWNGVDDVGYNFIYQLAFDSSKYEAGHRYAAEFAFETTSYGTIRWAQAFYVRSLLST
jgi:hypothetical protein